MDSIEAKELAKDFVVAGTASESLYGACESMFKPDMEPEELFETISQVLLSSVDRDCLSGWGGHVYVVYRKGSIYILRLSVLEEIIILDLMGNIIESFASGFGKVLGKLFSSPVDFLSGKSCSSVCGPTWDLFCYIENFCIAYLLRLALVFLLLYIVLLFFYISYKLGICTCIGWTICRSIWSCFSCWFHLWEYCCTFLCVKIHRLKRRRRLMKRHKFHTSSEQDYSDDESLSYYGSVGARDVSISSFSRRRKDYKESHLKKSLRARNHHARVRIRGDLSCKYRKRNHKISHDFNYESDNAISRHGIGNHSSTVHHDIKVVRTSKFVNKGGMKSRRRIPRRHNN